MRWLFDRPEEYADIVNRVDLEKFKDIAIEVAQGWQMDGLCEGLYFEYALTICERYLEKMEEQDYD